MKNKTIYIIKNYFANKNPTKAYQRKILSLLESIKEEYPTFYYNSLGKINLMDSNYSAALDNFQKALEIEPTNQSSLYQSFKTHIYLNNYPAAENYYVQFLKNVKHNPHNYDLLTKVMLMHHDLTENYETYFFKNYNLEEITVFPNYKFENFQIKNKFSSLVTSLNKKDLTQALAILSSLENVVVKYNIPIEVNTLKAIITKMQITEKKYYENLNLSPTLPPEIILNKIKNTNLSISQITPFLQKVIYFDITKAKFLIQKLLPQGTSNNLLQKEIKEHEFYLALSENQKDLNDYYLDAGRKALKENNYALAYDYFQAGKYLTENKLFYYYIGKTLYRSGNYAEAKKNFQLYNKEGATKIQKSYHYLLQIAKYEKNFSSIEKYRKKLNILNKNFSTYFAPSMKTSKTSTDIDYSKISAMHNLKEHFDFEKEDFIPEDVSSNIPLIQYLEKLKEMLQQKQIQKVNKILNKIKPQTSEEKSLLKQFIKNKKLYLNQ